MSAVSALNWNLRDIMTTAACTFLLFAFGVANATEDKVTDVAFCSKYTFHDKKISWSAAKEKCRKQERGSLVSMETEKEWHFVKNLTKKRRKTRWFIGLERVDGSHTWYWLSGSIACVNGTSAGTWRWNKGEPNNFEKEKCGEMWKNGKYGNIKCQGTYYNDDPGYICEKQVNCSTLSNNSENDDTFIERTTRPRSTSQPQATKKTSTSLRTQLTNTRNKLSEGSARRPQTPEAIRFKESSTKVGKLYAQPTTATFSTLQNRPTFNLSTQGTTFETAVGEYSPQNVSTGTFNLVLIVIVLLAIFILEIAVAFGVLFFRRHQGRMNQDAESAVSKESSNQRDFQGNLPMVTLNGCAQSSFSAGNETMNERLQSEPSVQRESLYAALCPQSVMTPEGNDSRTYASIDKSTREAKYIEYEIPIPTQRIQRKPFVQREGVYRALCPEPMMAPEGEVSRSYTSAGEGSNIEYVNVDQIPAPEYVNA